jgi:hypothetical protein
LRLFVVQVMPSSHAGGVPATQPAALAPAVVGEHCSMPLQYRPSPQALSW